MRVENEESRTKAKLIARYKVVIKDAVRNAKLDKGKNPLSTLH